jgi:phosphatidylglycerophosphatase A
MTKIFITFGFLGYSKYFPGTLASIAALPLGVALIALEARYYLLIIIVTLSIISFCLIKEYLAETSQEDPKEVVIDEVIGQLLAMLFCPLSLEAILLSFLIFRFFDILKIYPVNKIEKIGGAIGVIGDDVVSGIFTSIIIYLLIYLGML